MVARRAHNPKVIGSNPVPATRYKKALMKSQGFFNDLGNTVLNVGVWRSLVAHLHGVQGVGGSNPLTPTKRIKDLSLTLRSFFLRLLV